MTVSWVSLESTPRSARRTTKARAGAYFGGVDGGEGGEAESMVRDEVARLVRRARRGRTARRWRAPALGRHLLDATDVLTFRW